MPKQRFVTIEQAAQITGLSYKQIRERIVKGEAIGKRNKADGGKRSKWYVDPESIIMPDPIEQSQGIGEQLELPKARTVADLYKLAQIQKIQQSLEQGKSDIVREHQTVILEKTIKFFNALRRRIDRLGLTKSQVKIWNDIVTECQSELSGTTRSIIQ